MGYFVMWMLGYGLRIYNSYGCLYKCYIRFSNRKYLVIDVKEVYKFWFYLGQLMVWSVVRKEEVIFFSGFKGLVMVEFSGLQCKGKDRKM